MSESPESTQELTVTFQPPLYVQRRGWVFDLLRKEGLSEILDVGCGEGSLISCLCNPAPWLPPPPASSLASLIASASQGPIAHQSETKEDGDLIDAELCRLRPQYAPEVFLHPSKVIGLDISVEDLTCVVQASAPSDWRVRWEPLEVQIWKGGLEMFNPEFVGIECIVATEVIEHLPDNILHDFAPIILGAYHPRFLLITTPSYTFNARFTAPDAPPSARSGFPDPTGRSGRVFRHHDHKFEWTPEEFSDWCTSVADEWGYEVTVSGVGKAVEKDEWGRDEMLGYASQVAAFQRREGEEWKQKRMTQCKETSTLQTPGQTHHQLLATHQHIAHEKAQQPSPLPEIGTIIRHTMIDYRSDTVRLGELWWEEEVSRSCGGWMEAMLAAIQHHPCLHLQVSDVTTLSDWNVRLLGGVPDEDTTTESEETWSETILESSLSVSSDEAETLETPTEQDMTSWDKNVRLDAAEKSTNCSFEHRGDWRELEGSNESWGDGDRGWETNGESWSSDWTSDRNEDNGWLS